MLRIPGVIGLIFVSIYSFAQDVDTLRIMHYNILNYRNTTNQCTETTNSASYKEGHLSTISAYVMPDVITINEMGAHWLNPNKLLSNAFNTKGISHFEQMEFANNSFSSLTNMLFYNRDVLSKYKQDVIKKSVSGDELVRVTDVYTLFYNDEYGISRGDTTFITFIVTHLKAGSTSDDKIERAEMTEAIMAYLKDHKSNHSYFLCGDLNIQTSAEACYKNLVEATDQRLKFVDPVDAAGSWNNNSNYANLHTQSTHVSDTRGGCFSGGGMDDRFDFILCGKEVMDATYRVSYIPGTYNALGQDSRRFNGDMRSPSNNLIPTSVSEALYETSDHLPVILDVKVAKKTSSVQRLTTSNGLIVKYPSQNEVRFDFQPVEVSRWQIINSKGEIVFDKADIGRASELNLETEHFPPGIYIILIKTERAGLLINKFIAQ